MICSVTYSTYVLVPMLTKQYIIQQAFEQHCTFYITFEYEDDSKSDTLHCMLVDYNDILLKLKIKGIRLLSDILIDCPVQAYFRVIIDDDLTHYSFISTIAHISHPRTHLYYITLPMPTVLENRQRRNHMRIHPQPDTLYGGALWHKENIPESKNISCITQLPAPQLISIPHRITHFNINNISVGGIRLNIENEIMHKFDLQFDIADQCLLFMHLIDTDTYKLLKFLMLTSRPLKTHFGRQEGERHGSWRTYPIR